MSVIQGNAIESGLAAYEIPNSLRFNSADSAYLSWTPASAGNRKTWTWSAWVKRGKLNSGELNYLFMAGVSGNETVLTFTSNDAGVGANDTLCFYTYVGAGFVWQKTTAQLFRDTSAWYHIVAVLDTDNATAEDRARLYVNGTRVTSWQISTNPSSGYSGSRVSDTTEHDIGKANFTNRRFDGYLTEVNFIDGQALDPTSFGEYNSETGVWQPIAYAGTYGTNGFYLPMTQDQIVEGFNTVLWRGNGSSQRITGVGFSPDLVWIKDRTTTESNVLFDTVRGATNRLFTNLTNAEDSNATSLTAFGTDGFSLLNHDGVNKSGDNYVAWCWDAGNSTVSNTDGTITSSVRASQTYGFSVVTYTGNGSAGATIGHGLGTAPSLVIQKQRDGATAWNVYHSSLGGTKYLNLNTTDAVATGSGRWNDTDTTSSVVTLGSNTTVNNSGSTYVAYCFADTGYSKFGSYTGNGSSTGPTVTLGWKPAMVLIKSSSVGGGGYNWRIFDATRDGDDVSDYTLTPNGSYAENTDEYGSFSGPFIRYTDTGFQLVTSGAAINQSGATYIYAAFKDQREAAFWRDFSGNGNHWQPNNLDFNDSVVDVPTNYGTDTGVGAEVRGNYATLNPLFAGTSSYLSNGNLNASISASNTSVVGTFQIPSSGKWYWEYQITTIAGGGAPMGGVATTSASSPAVFYRSNGDKLVDGTGTSYGATYTTTDTIGIAVDVDGGTVTFYKNGSSQGAITYASAGYYPTLRSNIGTDVFNINFGQLPFAYTAPTGFKALCTTNLPDPAIADGSTAMNVITWSGTGGSRSFTGVGFSPDLVWTKSRSNVWWNVLFDRLRSGGQLSSNQTDAELASGSSVAGYVSSYDADGFSTTAGSSSNGTFNASGDTYVAWNWKAGGTGVSNTAGSITSTVSANTTAGFSIVTYTGTGSNATVGHGLGAAPSMVIIKDRDSGTNFWVVGTSSLSFTSDNYLRLNATTAVEAGGGVAWNNTAPTSTTVSIGNSTVLNASGNDYVMYCFAPVEGYSAFGSYTGNGSTDGVFVYTGFRPRWIMVKRTDTTADWVLYDTERNTYNVATLALYPNLSNAEGTVNPSMDILSNGVKFRNLTSTFNASGGTYIYAAFAENPFKYSLAR